jgi:hypothetical protein
MDRSRLKEDGFVIFGHVWIDLGLGLNKGR